MSLTNKERNVDTLNRVIPKYFKTLFMKISQIIFKFSSDVYQNQCNIKSNETVDSLANIGKKILKEIYPINP